MMSHALDKAVLVPQARYVGELRPDLPAEAFEPATSRLVIVMSFILTNHGLSPRVEINDPLVSGLSVTAPRWIEWLTLRFGYHVEHHLFPAMSSRYAPLVRDALQRRWPHRYQSMPPPNSAHLQGCGNARRSAQGTRVRELMPRS